MHVQTNYFLKVLHQDLTQDSEIQGDKLFIRGKSYDLDNALQFITDTAVEALKNPVLAKSEETQKEIQGIIAQFKKMGLSEKTGSVQEKIKNLEFIIQDQSPKKSIFQKFLNLLRSFIQHKEFKERKEDVKALKFELENVIENLETLPKDPEKENLLNKLQNLKSQLPDLDLSAEILRARFEILAKEFEVLELQLSQLKR